MSTTLLRVSDEDNNRILFRIGIVAIAAAVALTAIVVVYRSARGTPEHLLAVSIDTPYVGQGVDNGTPLIMHGVQVGSVTSVSSVKSGGIRLTADLVETSTRGLTDTVGIDFRPANYFGVTGINLIPGAGGQPLRSGSKISVEPRGNFALQALLYRLGELTDQVITPRLINVVERGTRFTDGLTPLLETLVTVSRTATRVQNVDTQRLLANATGITVALPGLFDGLISSGDLFLYSNVGLGYDPEKNLEANPYVDTYDPLKRRQYDEARALLARDPDAFAQGRYKEWLKGGETDLFSRVGKLMSSHIYDLFPVVGQIKTVSDVVHALIPPDDVSGTLRELRIRLERMYQGSGEQRALQLRLVLDDLPSMAGPVNLAIGAAG